MWEKFNPNPFGNRKGDCAVRAIAKAFNVDWYEAYDALTEQGRILGDMPSSDYVWGSFLWANGFRRKIVPNTCPMCYTVAQFCADHPQGTFILKLNEHVVTVENGIAFDSWNSLDEVVQYFWYKRG